MRELRNLEEEFVRGYLAALRDIDGPRSFERMWVIFHNQEAAARRALVDLNWMDGVDLDAMWSAAAMAPQTASERGTVYVLFDRGRRLYKIGFTGSDPHKRIAAIEHAVGARLNVVRLAAGTLDDERALHERFAELRQHGEWFRADPLINAWAGVS